MADKGAVGCSSLEEITTSVDILLTCLPNVETSRELFESDLLNFLLLVFSH